MALLELLLARGAKVDAGSQNTEIVEAAERG